MNSVTNYEKERCEFIIFDIISLDEGNLKILNRSQRNLELRLVQIFPY